MAADPADLPLEAALDRLLAAAREAWPDETEPWSMPTVFAKVLGDFAGAVRDYAAGLDRADLDWERSLNRSQFELDATRELGNLILTSARYLDDLGIPLPDAIAAATQAQQAYRRKEV